MFSFSSPRLVLLLCNWRCCDEAPTETREGFLVSERDGAMAEAIAGLSTVGSHCPVRLVWRNLVYFFYQQHEQHDDLYF